MKSIQLFKPNQIWIALSLCMLNLLFMHYHVIIVSERSFPPFCYIDNLFGILADISIVCLSTFYISGKRIKTAITMTFVISFLWSLCNVEYSRFFRHYITLSAIGQIGGLFGNGMMDSIIAGIQWCDMFYH